jgi:hypothetical protein
MLAQFSFTLWIVGRVYGWFKRNRAGCLLWGVKDHMDGNYLWQIPKMAGCAQRLTDYMQANHNAIKTI